LGVTLYIVRLKYLKGQKMMTGNDLLERWEKTGLLKGVEDIDRKYALATCLQVQMSVNEIFDDSVQWKRLSIPTVRRVFSVTRNLFVNENFDNLHENRVNYQFLKKLE
jgi:hypothetical protein